MKEFFKELFEYSYHYNQKLADILIEGSGSQKVSERSMTLFSHILNAHQIWNNRIEPRRTVFGVWEIQPIDQYKEIDKANFEHSIAILHKFDLNEVINYTNSRQQPFKNIVRDMLFHVINHSTYHRGQIAADLRQTGLDPLVTDYIFYKR